MKVKELIKVLERFDLEADVHLCVSWPDRVTEKFERVWVGDYGSGPQINAALDLKPSSIYVGCGLEQLVRQPREPKIDLGHYDSEEMAAKVHDFFVVHKGLDEPLNYSQFDYDKWIPPRTSSGEYNEHIAKILKEKLMKD